MCYPDMPLGWDYHKTSRENPLQHPFIPHFLSLSSQSVHVTSLTPPVNPHLRATREERHAADLARCPLRRRRPLVAPSRSSASDIAAPAVGRRVVGAAQEGAA